MKIIKKISFLVLNLLAIAAILILVFWVKTGKDFERDALGDLSQISAEMARIGKPAGSVAPGKIPAPAGPKEIAYKWTYDKKNYQLIETLYQSDFNFYSSAPKTFSYEGAAPPADWKEQYFGMFMKEAPGDNTIEKVAADLKALGKKNGLSDDQIAELAMSFVQSIPYDSAKADVILSGTGGTANYPYETLYEDRGVCSDKSFLAASLLKALGYGTTLFVYESENHMAIGVECPTQDSSYGSGYCYAETTTPGNKIGMIPDLNTATNQAESIQKINYFGGGRQTNPFDAKKLGPVEIFQKTNGKIYAGIAQTISTTDEIANLKQKISDEYNALIGEKKRIDGDAGQLSGLNNQMDKYLQKKEYSQYNSLVDKYNSLLAKYKKEASAYNTQVSDYNQKVNQYNNLAGSFYGQ